MRHPCHSWVRGRGWLGEKQCQKYPFKTRSIPCYCQLLNPLWEPRRVLAVIRTQWHRSSLPGLPTRTALARFKLSHMEKGTLRFPKVHLICCPHCSSHASSSVTCWLWKILDFSSFRNIRCIVSSPLPFASLRFSILPCMTKSCIASHFSFNILKSGSKYLIEFVSLNSP